MAARLRMLEGRVKYIDKDKAGISKADKADLIMTIMESSALHCDGAVSLSVLLSLSPGKRG